MIVLLAVYGASLFSLCSYVSPDCQTVPNCLWVYPSRNGTVVKGLWSGWGEAAHRPLLYTLQHSTALAFVIYLGINYWLIVPFYHLKGKLYLYLVLISLSFVHRQHHFWQVNPFKNQLWIACSALV